MAGAVRSEQYRQKRGCFVRSVLCTELPHERALMMENQAIAIELTKLVASNTQPAAGGDVFRAATDYVSIYRYILNDLHHRKE